MPLILVEIAPVIVPPARGIAPISANDHDIFALPSTDFPVEPIVIVLAVPQVAVVIAALPLKLVPLSNSCYSELIRSC